MIALGQYGSNYASSGTAVAVRSGFDIVALQFVGASSFSALTAVTGASCVNNTGVLFPAGLTIFGRWSAATLNSVDNSGVIAYFAPSL